MFATPRSYPWESQFRDRTVTFRLMSVDDRELFKNFIRSLPHEDNFHLMLDVHDDHAIDRWMKGVDSGQIISVIALENDQMIGYCNIHRNELSWVRHVGEIGMGVSRDYRGLGVGKALTNEVFAIARACGLRKIWARMAASQEAAQNVFHSLHFRTEALLSDFVMNQNGGTEDLVIMTYDAGKPWAGV
jgi:ribosomal protein S18 acetylase RimI-like enzyme